MYQCICIYTYIILIYAHDNGMTTKNGHIEFRLDHSDVLSAQIKTQDPRITIFAHTEPLKIQSQRNGPRWFGRKVVPKLAETICRQWVFFGNGCAQSTSIHQ